MTVIYVVTIMALVIASSQDGHGHSHGHAYSSQRIVLHHSHSHKVHHEETFHQYKPLHMKHQSSSKHGQHHHASSSQSFKLHSSKHVASHQTKSTNYVKKLHGLKKQEHQDDYKAHPKYSFEYKVQDPHTGDNKYQHETRDGDVVKGVYNLHEADGTVRIVEHSADKHTGCKATVRHEGRTKHNVPTYYRR